MASLSCITALSHAPSLAIGNVHTFLALTSLIFGLKIDQDSPSGDEYQYFRAVFQYYISILHVSRQECPLTAEHQQLLSQILYEEVPRATECLQDVQYIPKLEKYLTARSTQFMKMSAQKAGLPYSLDQAHYFFVGLSTWCTIRVAYYSRVAYYFFVGPCCGLKHKLRHQAQR